MSQFEKIFQNVLKVQQYLHQRLPFKIILTMSSNQSSKVPDFYLNTTVSPLLVSLKLSLQNCIPTAGIINICSVSDYSNCMTDYAGRECIC
jgi:hypothetical protein